MYKKFIQTALAVIILALGAQTSFATTSSGSGYNAPVIRSAFNFTAVLQNGAVNMTWVPYAPAGFNYYKVVRSTTNSNPVYPDDGYILASSDAGLSNYVDNDPPTGKTYYRVCSIVSPNRYCSPVVTLTNSGDSVTEPVSTVTTISLNGSWKTDGYIQLTWALAGTAPNGFKIAKSTTHEKPTYPVMSGDSYYYLSEPGVRSYKDSDVAAGKTYYFRVCQYTSSGTCQNYSNAIAVSVPSGALVNESPVNESGTLVPASVNLSGQAKEGYAWLNWTVNGQAPYGFKVCKSSVNKEPTYPIKAGDAYQYLTDPNVRSMKDPTVKTGVTYYYRVCQYDGKGTCVAYSNAVAIAMATDGADAAADKTTSVPSELVPATLALTGAVGDGYLKLGWTIDGSAPNGFKIAKSTVNEKPTYPVMEGDDYVYLSDPVARYYKDTAVESGKTYHYRVCQYTGSGCLSYSNAVSLEVPGGWITTEKVVPEKTVGSLKDVKNHPYGEAIGYMVNKNIVQGYSDNTFRPDLPVNRAEFLKMLLMAKFGKDGVGEEMRCFKDVTTGWYAPYVCFAKKKGVVSGYKDGTFKPSRTISFAEAAKMVAELYGMDAPKGSNWYEGYVKALEKKKSIPPSVAAPAATLTRGEVAELVWRVKEGKTDQPTTELTGEGEAVNQGAVPGWQTFEKNDYSFSYPAGWYRGLKSYGWDIVSEEKDYIDNLNVPNYMAVDTYVATYIASRGATSESALASKVWFGHPLVDSKKLTVNGYPALRRHYRAPRGTVVNGRTTGENENIYVYTFLKDGKVIVVQYFNAYGDENYGVDQFDKIASSFQ